MKNLVKPMGKFIALLAFLPITPSIAALTVFTQSVVNKSSTESIPLCHVERVLKASRIW